MAKTRADPNASNKNKKKKRTKHLLNAPAAAAAMKSSSRPAKPNPFDVLWSRRKFDVLGRTRRGEERGIGLSRSIAIDKRKNTLLKEYEGKGKSSKFMDMRIGETDDTLQEFDKALLRLQRERQLKLKRGSKYNLSDGDEDDTAIYHVQSLSEKDDFEEDIPFDDDEDLLEDGPNSSKYLTLHTGCDPVENTLPDGDENAHKTKKQVMSELISKSEFYKKTVLSGNGSLDHKNTLLGPQECYLACKI